jgi:TPR repeat protein
VIAGMYRFGEGRRVDLPNAARWYQRAADLGEAIAQLNLGEMYMLGLGVPRDAARAHLWLTLAARQGRAWARDRRDGLARQMTTEELDRANRLLRKREAPK